MNLKKVKGTKVRLSFWTNDRNIALEIRKILIKNNLKMEWHEEKEYGYILIDNPRS